MTDTSAKSDTSTKALIKRSWQLLLDNWAIVIGAVFFHAVRNTAIATILLFFVIDLPASPFIFLGVAVALCMTSSYFDISSICLNIVRGKPAKLSIVPNVSRTIVWLTATVIFAVACAVGLVFLVIPGLIVAVLFSMYGFGIIDGDNPIASLSRSYRIARAKFRQISLLFVTFFVLSVIPNPLHIGFAVALGVALTFGLCIIYTSDYRRSGQAMNGLVKGVLKSCVLILALQFPIFVALVSVRVFVQARYIPSLAMEPTLRVNDRIALESVSKWKGHMIERGAIVCFYPPACELPSGREPPSDLPHVLGHLTGLPMFPNDIAFIKRIIGVAGDRIRIAAGKGVYVNDKLLSESYITEPANYSLNSLQDIGGRGISGDLIQPYANQSGQVVVPPGTIFVLGDNRNNSEDSHVFGFVPENRVIGRAWCIYSPIYSYMHEPYWMRP